MKLKTIFLFLLSFINFACLVNAKEWSPEDINLLATPKQVEKYKESFDISRTATGYIYIIPPYLHLKQRYHFLENFKKFMGKDVENPFGEFLLLREPANAKTKDVMPNYDTLYGVTFLELDNSPVVLTVPNIENRYYSLALVDAYFYNFDYIGSRVDGQKAGKYLIVGPQWKGKKPNGIKRIIVAPTNSINIYQRIYFKDLNDIKNVNKIQDSIKILPLAKFLNPNARILLPDIKKYLNNSPITNDPVKVIELTNTYIAENQAPIEDKGLLDYIAPVFIGPNLKVPNSKSVRDTIIKAVKQASNDMTAVALSDTKIVNGWQIPSPHIGKRGGAGSMVLQAMAQLRSIGINSAQEAVYYNAYQDSEEKPLNGKNNYTITITKENIPPIQLNKFGFWSITIYERKTAKFYDNKENKYVLRSGNNFIKNKDGSITLYIQNKEPNDKKLKNNWLPSPNLEFFLTLRVYLGKEPVINGTYVPPKIILSN